MQAGKESRRQGRKGRTVEGRSTGTAAEGPERRRKKGRDGDGRKTERRRKKNRAATEEKPSGDGRKAKEGGTEEDGNDKRTDGDDSKTRLRIESLLKGIELE